MHLTQLDIEGFRSLASVSWKPGKLNVVIGPNGSGKSNLLRLLEMISIGGRGHLSDYIQSEGGMDALVWDGQAREIQYTVRTSQSESNLPPMVYAVTLAHLGHGNAYHIADEALTNADEMMSYLQRSARRSEVHGYGTPVVLREDATGRQT